MQLGSEHVLHLAPHRGGPRRLCTAALPQAPTATAAAADEPVGLQSGAAQATRTAADKLGAATIKDGEGEASADG